MVIETLLISGENNHDWVRSAAFCRDLMQGTGRFNLHVTEEPSELLADRSELSKYQLFFVDYNGSDWGEAAKENFVDAVRNGTGVCILHAADNAFDGWKEFEEICALCWRKGTSHGTYHKFDIEITNPNHPITKGCPPMLKDHPDELYHNLVHMHDTPYETIAIAHSSLESGGTGNDEPVLVVKTYGKGGDAEKQKAYARFCEQTLTELCTRYGEVFEIWCDGGVLPASRGGPDILSILAEHQPNAVVFQGPPGTPNPLRWVGNERGVAPYPCWSTVDKGSFEDGMTEKDMAGNRDAKRWAPAEVDVPMRESEWGWKANQET